MVDILVIFLLMCIFYKLKYNHTSFYQDYISKDNMQSLKGMFAIMIMMHHISQLTKGGYLFPFFLNVGFLVVSYFFFSSGYGLLKNHIENPHYQKNFFQKRITSVALPYIIVTFLYWGLSAIEKPVYTIKDIIRALLDGNPIVLYSWFICALLLFYFAFFLLMFIFREKYVAIIISAILICILAAIIFAKRRYGFCWYNSCISLVLGMLWALYQDKLITILQKSYWIWLAASTILFFISFQFRDIYNQWAVNLLIYWIISCLFNITLFLILMKCKIQNPILHFLGGISFELYMIHGIFVKLYRGNHIYIDNEFIWSILIIISAIISAYILNKFVHVIQTKITLQTSK